MIVTSTEAALLILTIEFGVLAVVIAFLSYRGARTVEADTTAQACDLVGKVSNTEDARRTALQTVFKDKYQFEGGELTAAVDEFMQREKAFYNAVVGAFLGRGDKKISDLNDELTKVVAPWISITPKNMIDRETAESLVAEKSHVQSELNETKQVLEKMMVEYNRAFNIDPTGPASPETANEYANDIEELDEASFSVDLAEDDPHVHEAAQAGGPELRSDMIEELDDEDDFAATADPPPGVETSIEKTDDPGLISEMIEELDDEDVVVPVVETPVDLADKPMTADDLDDLMESLEEEPISETETA